MVMRKHPNGLPCDVLRASDCAICREVPTVFIERGGSPEWQCQAQRHKKTIESIVRWSKLIDAVICRTPQEGHALRLTADAYGSMPFESILLLEGMDPLFFRLFVLDAFNTLAQGVMFIEIGEIDGSND
ncbi:hypothetical protein LCGC14_2791670 [marine sediment metagenome]|uniref:Uncharacterized protein n=1 Tax=marine sediment metagenome TaxID=412755 RepID=A0A0F8YQF1_9ZZZZ